MTVLPLIGKQYGIGIGNIKTVHYFNSTVNLYAVGG